MRPGMTEKETIISWNDAAELYKANPNDLSTAKTAAEKFEKLVASNPHHGVSKICYNAAILHKYLGDFQAALRHFNMCLEKDPHNAMAYFQRATVLYDMERYADAAKDNQKCVDMMRQITVIDYSQLGLRSKLYQHEAIFNEAACHLRLDNNKNCAEALLEVKSLTDKDVTSAPKTLDITGALQSIRNGANRLEIIQRGVDKLYTPPQVKLNNLAKKDYLGKAKVVSSLQSGDTFSGFSGPKLAPPDRPDFPRSTTPTPMLEKSGDDSSPSLPRRHNGRDPDASAGQVPLVDELKSLQLQRPDAPTKPPPKPTPRPTPSPRNINAFSTISSQSSESNGSAMSRGSISSQGSTSSQNSTSSKPALTAKPSLCKVDLISGALSDTMLLVKNSDYEKLMADVQKTLGYGEGTYSLWYMNRQGTYTAIEGQHVVEHLWKHKVRNNTVTIYVFGV